MKRIAFFAGLLTALAPLCAFADVAVFKLDPSKSSLTYKIVHKFHEAEGVDKKLQGAAAVKPGEAQVQIRAQVADFDSGNANRDGHMKETVEEAKFPDVTLKGVLPGFAVPDKFPAKVDAKLQGKLTFHGVTNDLSAPVTLQFDDASHVHVTSEFDVSLDAYKIDRPSLLFVKIDDACHIKVDLVLAR